ncbi:MAG: hypothetical protein GXO98_03090 [Nitrospirae bacterium]|nr:hypothetical protein [Nitrospirota bacterium]
MKKVRKRIMWIISFLLLLSVLGCSLKIDIDPSKFGKSNTGHSTEEAR